MTTARTLSRTVAGLLALSIAGWGSLLAAATPEPAASEPPPSLGGIVEKLVEKIDEDAVEKIDDTHEAQARFFGEVFEKVDRVFGEEYVDDRERKVKVGVGLEHTLNYDGTTDRTALKIGLRVPLPALNRRLNSYISIGGDVNELGGVSTARFSDSEKIFSIAAALIRRYRDNTEVGIKLNLFRNIGDFFSAQPFVRFEQKHDSTRYYFQEQIIWDSDNSWSSLTDLDVDRRFISGMFLRLRNRVDYTFGEAGASIAHGLIIRRSVFETSGLSFETWLEYNTSAEDPTTIKDDTIVYAQLRLRGRIWRNWLEYELRPIYTLPINTDRDAFFGFLVGFTVIWDSYLGGGGDDVTNLNR